MNGRACSDTRAFALYSARRMGVCAFARYLWTLCFFPPSFVLGISFFVVGKALIRLVGLAANRRSPAPRDLTVDSQTIVPGFGHRPAAVRVISARAGVEARNLRGIAHAKIETSSGKKRESGVGILTDSQLHIHQTAGDRIIYPLPAAMQTAWPALA